MKIEIYDPSVLDSTPMTKADVMESLGLSETALRNAIDKGYVPGHADYGGPNGTARWFVGMFRMLNEKKSKAAVENYWRVHKPAYAK